MGVFDKILKDNGRYSWLRGMELDRYYPRLRLAFEYQGEQHFEDKKFFKIKREICNNRSIILVEISYREKLSEQLILAKLKEKGSVTNQRAL